MAYTVLATPFAVSGTQPLILSSSFSAPDSLGNQSIKLFNASAENDIGVHCDGGTYGFSPNVADCETGQYQIPGDTEVFQFVERPNAAGNDLPLPFRLLGDQGHCYFQPVVIGDHASGRASFANLRLAALALVDKCAIESAKGGIATNIGGDNNVAVIMSEYKPQVQCRGSFSASATGTCNDILFAMKADRDLYTFGPASDPATEEELPVYIRSMVTGCSVQIFSTGTADTSSWYEIWEAVTAVSNICVQNQLKGGSLRGIGQNGKIFLTIKEVFENAVPINGSLDIV
ncbi:hypothetical protein MMC28_009001 [Mycoblastus sanguinarius]|nr:hypothetical protein [Mycoblastus sanguinarius]